MNKQLHIHPDTYRHLDATVHVAVPAILEILQCRSLKFPSW